MTPATFLQAHLLYGDEQPEYLLVPGHFAAGVATVCMEVSDADLEVIRVKRRVWIQIKTANGQIQPMRVSSVCPLP